MKPASDVLNISRYRKVARQPTGVRTTVAGETNKYYSPEDLGVFGPNNNVRLLWNKTDGRIGYVLRGFPSVGNETSEESAGGGY